MWLLNARARAHTHTHTHTHIHTHKTVHMWGIAAKTLPLKSNNASGLKLLDYGKELHSLHTIWLWFNGFVQLNYRFKTFRSLFLPVFFFFVFFFLLSFLLPFFPRYIPASLIYMLLISYVVGKLNVSLNSERNDCLVFARRDLRIREQLIGYKHETGKLRCSLLATIVLYRLLCRWDGNRILNWKNLSVVRTCYLY
jgi:hypothetical protein